MTELTSIAFVALVAYLFGKKMAVATGGAMVVVWFLFSFFSLGITSPLVIGCSALLFCFTLRLIWWVLRRYWRPLLQFAIFTVTWLGLIGVCLGALALGMMFVANHTDENWFEGISEITIAVVKSKRARRPAESKQVPGAKTDLGTCSTTCRVTLIVCLQGKTLTVQKSATRPSYSANLC